MLTTILQQPITTILILLGVGLTAVVGLPAYNIEFQRSAALVTSLAALLVGLAGSLGFDKATTSYQFIERFNILPMYNLNLTLGLDGLGMLFLLLTLFVFPLCFVAS
jgi:NADH-quinone oxidoreductase subunit M